MSKSPYLSQDLKDYISKKQVHLKDLPNFQLEENLNTAVNNMLRVLPEDPYSYLVDYLEKVIASIFPNPLGMLSKNHPKQCEGLRSSNS